MTQQWQAAPWRKSSGVCGVRMEQTGSEEQRRALRRAVVTTLWNRVGSLSWTRPPEGPVAVRGSGADQESGCRLPVLGFGPGIEAFAQAGGRVAAGEGEFTDQDVGKGVQEPVARGLEAAVGVDLAGCLGEAPLEVPLVRFSVGLPHVGVQDALLPAGDGGFVELEEDTLAAVFGRHGPCRPGRPGQRRQTAREVADTVHVVDP